MYMMQRVIHVSVKFFYQQLSGDLLTLVVHVQTLCRDPGNTKDG
jgi:hypothetical protein